MDVKNFRFKDKDGNVLYEFPITGVAPDITVSASVDNNVGTPSVIVTKSGENDAPTYQLDFKNLKGNTGTQGIQGVQGVQGPPVTLDTSVSTTSHNGVENQAITNYVNNNIFDKFATNKIYAYEYTTGVAGANVTADICKSAIDYAQSAQLHYSTILICYLINTGGTNSIIIGYSLGLGYFFGVLMSFYTGINNFKINNNVPTLT